jgi:ABC-2 type transport system permease protein
MTEITELWRYREVMWNLVRRNLKVRYKNSVLGFFWSLLNPLMQIAVWWFVFKVILESTEPNYTATLITGFLPWLFFSQTVLDSTMSVTQEISLVKKAYFPRAILPLSTVLSNLIHLGFAFIVLLALFAIWRVDMNVYWLLVIPSTLLIAVFAYGLSAMLAAWSVFYADVKFIVGNLLGLWFFLTPVLYPLYLVLNKQMQAHNWLLSLVARMLPLIKKAYLADPVTIGILGYRSALLQGGANPIVVPALSGMEPAVRASLQASLRAQYPIATYVIAAAVIAIVVAIAGHAIFVRLSHLFAERG